jgi:hypothetical protein
VIISSISIITVLGLEWSNGCKYPLRIWLLIQFFIQISQIFLEIIYFRINSVGNDRSCFSIFITLISRVNNMLWLSWFITGMIWTFQAVYNFFIFIFIFIFILNLKDFDFLRKNFFIIFIFLFLLFFYFFFYFLLFFIIFFIFSRFNHPTFSNYVL